MFGMSSTDFWENDPQLYWAYRTFYLKQREVEREDLKYEVWLRGSIDFMATSLAIKNNFSNNGKPYPTYDELFGEENINKEQTKLTKKDIDKQIINEFNAWARY